MSPITDMAQARLDRWQRSVNKETIVELARRNIALEDFARYVIDCIDNNRCVDNDALNRARDLVQS